MKIVTIILLLLVFSCSSPERKIKQSFNAQRGKIKIENVKIYDTIYAETLSERMEFFDTRIKFLERSVKMSNEYRDSIRGLQYPKPIEDSLLRIGYRWRRERQNELNALSFKQTFSESLYSEMDDTIVGYYAKIITRYDTIDFIVSPITFQLVCPVYMYENNHNELRKKH